MERRCLYNAKHIIHIVLVPNPLCLFLNACLGESVMECIEGVRIPHYLILNRKILAPFSPLHYTCFQTTTKKYIVRGALRSRSSNSSWRLVSSYLLDQYLRSREETNNTVHQSKPSSSMDQTFK